MNGRLDAPSRRRSIRRGLDTHTRALEDVSPLYALFFPQMERGIRPLSAHTGENLIAAIGVE